MPDPDSILSVSAAHGHSGCMVCGEANPRSLGLCFTPRADGSVMARFTGNAGLQGYAGILHGGVIASLLDAAMTHCLFHQGIEAVTADLHVRYAHAVPCEACLEITANTSLPRPPLYRLKAEISRNGQVMAWAEAKFITLKTHSAVFGG